MLLLVEVLDPCVLAMKLWHTGAAALTARLSLPLFVFFTAGLWILVNVKQRSPEMLLLLSSFLVLGIVREHPVAAAPSKACTSLLEGACEDSSIFVVVALDIEAMVS